MRPGPDPAIARVSSDGTIQNSTPARHHQRLAHRRPHPESGEAARTIGDDDRGDRLPRYAGPREQPSIAGQERRGVLPGALDLLVRPRRGRSAAQRHRQPAGRGIDREPHQPISRPRTAGSARCDSRTRSVAAGAQPAARSGHSISSASPSAARPSQSRSAASSGSLQPVAVEMEDRPAPPGVAMHQRVGRAGRRLGARRARARWRARRWSSRRPARPARCTTEPGRQRPADALALRASSASVSARISAGRGAGGPPCHRRAAHRARPWRAAR